jgi:hypothetical protein
MKPSTLKVLTVLRFKKRKGVTFDDFERGMEVRKRLSELRYAGYKMTWVWEMLSNGGRRKRHFLIGEPS